MVMIAAAYLGKCPGMQKSSGKRPGGMSYTRLWIWMVYISYPRKPEEQSAVGYRGHK